MCNNIGVCILIFYTNSQTFRSLAVIFCIEKRLHTILSATAPFSQSGYRFALLAAFLPPVRTPVFPLYPYYNLNRVFWPVFRKLSQKQRTFKEKIQLISFFSFYSTRFHAILLSKYNCSVRVEDEYHTEHGQAALRRDFNFDSPVTQ